MPSFDSARHTTPGFAQDAYLSHLEGTQANFTLHGALKPAAIR